MGEKNHKKERPIGTIDLVKVYRERVAPGLTTIEKVAMEKALAALASEKISK